MPNAVKYNSGNVTGSIRKGDIALGVNLPFLTSNTPGWYNGPNPPTSGLYQIIETAASGDPDVYCPQNDTELTNFARWKGATGANTGSVAAILAWIGTQTNLMAANFQYENIVTDGLLLTLDAGFVGSYPTTGTTIYNLGGTGNNGTFINSPTFNSANSGSIVFDGIDDYVVASFTNLGFDVPWTLGCWFNTSVAQSNNVGLFNLSYFPELMMRTDGKVFVWNSVGSSAGTGFSYPAVDSINSYNNGQWHYAVGSYTTGGLVKLYVDGALVNSASYAPNGVRAIYNGVYMGMEFNNGPKVFNGKIALGQVYNRQLTDQEVLQNYNAQKGRFGL